MAPEGLKLFFRLGMFVTLTALFLIFTVPRGTAEFVVSLLSLALGVTLLILIALVSWWTGK